MTDGQGGNNHRWLQAMYKRVAVPDYNRQQKKTKEKITDKNAIFLTLLIDFIIMKL